MLQNIEISELDLRYESFRIKNPVCERKLLASVQENGIREPLWGADVTGKRIVLDGFKRLRCARRLKIETVPYMALAQDEAGAIMRVLRGDQMQPLTILEQARFVDELHQLCRMSLGEIAEHLSRSKSWVSLRLGLCAELSEAVREKLFTGQFPVRAYLYSIRPFTRVNSGAEECVDPFILAVSGKGLSAREIDFLFGQCFGSSPAWREQILSGQLELPLRHYRESQNPIPGCSSADRQLLKDLELLTRLMRTVSNFTWPRASTPDFQAQASLATAGILKHLAPFLKKVKEIHARTAPV
jgi:hypothetical protein